jgi:hypothetical protein
LTVLDWPLVYQYKRVDSWAEFFAQAEDIVIGEKMRKHEQRGRPLGSENFVMKLEGIEIGCCSPKRQAGNQKK